MRRAGVAGFVAGVTLATAIGAGASTGPFADVPEGHPHRAGIEAAHARGVIWGEGGNFDPDAPVTRAQLATILARLEGWVPDVIAEDDPRWDCATMGNRVCG
jgi:hypothetical protein